MASIRLTALSECRFGGVAIDERQRRVYVSATITRKTKVSLRLYIFELSPSPVALVEILYDIEALAMFPSGVLPICASYVGYAGDAQPRIVGLTGGFIWPDFYTTFDCIAVQPSTGDLFGAYNPFNSSHLIRVPVKELRETQTTATAITCKVGPDFLRLATLIHGSKHLYVSPHYMDYCGNIEKFYRVENKELKTVAKPLSPSDDIGFLLPTYRSLCESLESRYGLTRGRYSLAFSKHLVFWIDLSEHQLCTGVWSAPRSFIQPTISQAE